MAETTQDTPEKSVAWLMWIFAHSRRKKWNYNVMVAYVPQTRNFKLVVLYFSISRLPYIQQYYDGRPTLRWKSQDTKKVKSRMQQGTTYLIVFITPLF